MLLEEGSGHIPAAVAVAGACSPPRSSPDAGELGVPSIYPKAAAGARKRCVARDVRGRLDTGRSTFSRGGGIARQQLGVIERSGNADGSIGSAGLRKLSSTLISAEDGAPATPCRGKER